MDSSRSTSNLSPISNPSDRSFVYSINNFIEDELRLIDSNEKNANFLCKERYLVFRHAFSKVIAYVQAYKSLLSNIKKEYELFIEELEKNQLEFDSAQDELVKLKSTYLTISNLENKKDELKNKLNALRSENDRLNKNLNKLLAENEKYRDEDTGKYDFLNQKKKAQQDEKDDFALIPGLSVEKAIDLSYLTNLLGDLEIKINELHAAQSRKYSNKQQKCELERVLFEKIQLRDCAQAESIKIKNKINLYKFALNAVKDYYDGKTRYTDIQDALSRGLINNYLLKNPKVDEDNDNLDDSYDESDLILEFIEKFNDFFDSAKYADAAYFAAASPRKCLNNIETLYKFKNISDLNSFSEDTDPLFIYCNSIIDSMNDVSTKPTEDMSVECIRIALKFNKVDLLTRWIAQRKITFSYQAAQLVEDYARLKAKNSKSAFELALFIYTDIKAPLEATICMAKLGRLSSMIDFIKSQKSLSSNNEIYFHILKECPSVELATEIMDVSISENLKIPVDKIVAILLDSDQPENGLKFLKIQIQKSSIYDESDENLKKLKTSYETLVKFSFLAQEDEHFTKETALEGRDQLMSIYSAGKAGLPPRHHREEADFSIHIETIHPKLSRSAKKERRPLSGKSGGDSNELKSIPITIIDSSRRFSLINDEEFLIPEENEDELEDEEEEEIDQNI